ncbi:MAG: SprT-like domain-containing protein, partial [Longimicrobiales bacterium]
VDTLLHEMAHAEAWLLHAHREHGRPWRTVARRVGCEARACSTVRIRRRRRRERPAETVPNVRKE